MESIIDLDVELYIILTAETIPTVNNGVSCIMGIFINVNGKTKDMDGCFPGILQQPRIPKPLLHG
jgi:hypothetical protein